MNIRKNIDYADMYAALASALGKNLSQVERYYEIGKAVCQRSEKGAAVAAAAYLSKQYPDAQGFSPRNLRRMRNFYRTYEGYPALLEEALQIGWTQNVVILEADLSMELREWYLKASKQFGWTKTELTEKIATNVHEVIALTGDEKNCRTKERKYQKGVIDVRYKGSLFACLNKESRSWPISGEKARRRWRFVSGSIPMWRQSVSVQC